MQKQPNIKQLVDLTHTLSSTIPTWDLTCGFQDVITMDYVDSTTSAKFRVQQLQMQAGIGTHMDAPLHCFPNTQSIADIPLNHLISPCIVINVASKMHEDLVVDTKDILDFESQFGMLALDTFVIIHTGWSQFWDEPKKYHHQHRFPRMSKEAAQLLLDRSVVGIGIDTLSPDGNDYHFPVHQIMLGADKYIVENVAHADILPPIGAYALALPIKIGNGTEAPIRLVGMVFSSTI